MRFIVGQRWVSQTEIQLGLGIITDNSNRRVTVSFPAVGEKRTYASDNAPLSRIQYKAGDHIQNIDEQFLTVKSVKEQNGLLVYESVDEHGEECVLDELELNCFIQFSAPDQRLRSGQFDKNTDFQLRVETINHINRLQKSPVRGLLGSRVSLLHHQLYIAYQVAQRHAPRVLLADEVGLGKTIEAGMIIHYQLFTGKASRVLIVVPDSLIHQWMVELLRRFNLRFSIFDEERYFAIKEEGIINPFEAEQLVLCSLSFLLSSEEILQSAVEADWGLLVIDEAHHLYWSEAKVSQEYTAIEKIALRCDGLILLTATPEQVGIESHFARLRLLDPARFYNLNLFKQEEESYQKINTLVQKLLALDGKSIDKHLAKQLEESLNEKLDFETLNSTAVIQILLDRHGTGRVLFRNTREAVKGFPDRELHVHPMQYPNCYQQVEKKNINDHLYPEKTLKKSDWLKYDPRVEWLINLLNQLHNAKVLIICVHAEVAIALERHLHLKAGIRCAAFYEGLSIIERDRAAAYFSETESGAQALVCSEIGSEGRNFQFANHLVLFDLPLNPDLLEQRIGRLDRIGQQNTVNIHVPYFQGSAQEVLFRWFHNGINLFEQSCSVAYSIYERFAEQLHACLIQANDYSQLLEETASYSKQIRKILFEGRDSLLELNSCNPAFAEKLITDIQQEEASDDLENYMAGIFDIFGVEHEFHSDKAQVLYPSNHMRCSDFPGLKEDGTTVVFDRTRALVREDMEFLSWEHPMVAETMDMLLTSELGNVALAVFKVNGIAAGTLLMESYYTVMSVAPKYLQLQQFLPLTPVRVVNDIDGRHYAEVLPQAQLNRIAQNIEASTARSILNKIDNQLDKLFSISKKAADQYLPKIIDNVKLEVDMQLSTEINRLIALQKVNKSVRDEEIQYFQQKLNACNEYIERATLPLQAVRLLVAT